MVKEYGEDGQETAPEDSVLLPEDNNDAATNRLSFKLNETVNTLFSASNDDDKTKEEKVEKKIHKINSKIAEKTKLELLSDHYNTGFTNTANITIYLLFAIIIAWVIMSFIIEVVELDSVNQKINLTIYSKFLKNTYNYIVLNLFLYLRYSSMEFSNINHLEPILDKIMVNDLTNINILYSKIIALATNINDESILEIINTSNITVYEKALDGSMLISEGNLDSILNKVVYYIQKLTNKDNQNYSMNTDNFFNRTFNSKSKIKYDFIFRNHFNSIYQFMNKIDSKISTILSSEIEKESNILLAIFSLSLIFCIVVVIILIITIFKFEEHKKLYLKVLNDLEDNDINTLVAKVNKFSKAIVRFFKNDNNMHKVMHDLEHDEVYLRNYLDYHFFISSDQTIFKINDHIVKTEPKDKDKLNVINNLAGDSIYAVIEKDIDQEKDEEANELLAKTTKKVKKMPIKKAKSKRKKNRTHLEAIVERNEENSRISETDDDGMEEISPRYSNRQHSIKKAHIPVILAVNNDYLLSEPDLKCIGIEEPKISKKIESNLLLSPKNFEFGQLRQEIPDLNLNGDKSSLKSNLERTATQIELKAKPVIENNDYVIIKEKKSFLEYSSKWKNSMIYIFFTFIIVTSYFIISITYLFTYIDNIIAIIKNSEAFDKRIVLSSNQLISMNLLLLYNITSLGNNNLIPENSNINGINLNDFDIQYIYDDIFTNEKNYTFIMKVFPTTATIIEKYKIYETNKNCDYLKNTLGIDYILEQCKDYKLVNGISFEIIDINDAIFYLYKEFSKTPVYLKYNAFLTKFFYNIDFSKAMVSTLLFVRKNLEDMFITFNDYNMNELSNSKRYLITKFAVYLVLLVTFLFIFFFVVMPRIKETMNNLKRAGIFLENDVFFKLID